MMKIKNLAALLLFFGLTVFLSCAKQEINTCSNQKVRDGFWQKFPNARQVEWETEHGFWVAEFRDGGYDKEAWFDTKGSWLMTEIDIPFRHLPDAVQAAFQAGTYGSWRVEDVDMIERLNYETMYVIEVERGEQEVDLYYIASGTLIREDVGGGDSGYYGFLPEEVASDMKNWINQRYPGAVIIEMEFENGWTEVEIFYSNTVIDVYFNEAGQWQLSKREVIYGQVPQPVKSAFTSSAWASWTIDDIDFVEQPEFNFYEFELERGDQEKVLTIKEDGTIF